MFVPSKHFDRFIMVAPGSDYGVAMWSDLKSIENVDFLDYVIAPQSRFVKTLHHIHFSFGINSKIQLPFQRLWKRQYSLGKCDLSKRTCIIFTDISACRTDVDYLNYLCKLENVTMVMVLVNVVSSKAKLLHKRFKFFNQIYSFDKKDCDKYGFLYYPTFYSVTRTHENKKSILSDAFFVGVSKGNRHCLLKELYEKIRNKSGVANFFINGVRNSNGRLKGIHYNQWLSYKNVLDQVLETNCVVEIMDPNQSGLTLRAMEAIVYNKKLFTNNVSVKSLKYYDTGFIRYFEKIEDDDIDFICKKDLVDFQYQGDFSPIHLLDRIDNQKNCETKGYA